MSKRGITKVNRQSFSPGWANSVFALTSNMESRFDEQSCYHCNGASSLEQLSFSYFEFKTGLILLDSSFQNQKSLCQHSNLPTTDQKSGIIRNICELETQKNFQWHSVMLDWSNYFNWMNIIQNKENTHISCLTGNSVYQYDTNFSLFDNTHWLDRGVTNSASKKNLSAN